MLPAPSAPRIPQGKCLTVGGRAEGGVLQYTQLLNPRNSMSITNTKGLLNMPGQNNCFLNSAVQVLWHLDIFRRSFRELCGHACMEDSCIFCALKELFAQFQYSQESALPPDALRRALAETFCDQRRFQLGFMDDAAECFENILMRIHFHIANSESEDMCSALHCIPHQKFAMTLVEQTVCHACGATSEPLPFTQMVHYVPSSALCSQAKLMKDKTDQIPSFSELLKRAGGLGDFRDCPSSCGAVIQIRKTLMNHPEIVSIGLVWDSERPTIDHIMDVFKTIGMSLKLQDVFHSVVDSRWASTATHQLVGIVTYYGKHYSTFFFHTKLRVWIYFDDAAVREIGPKWEQVVEKCCRGHFQPLLLLYANPLGTPVDTSTAPRIIKVVPTHKKTISGKESDDLNLSHEKSSRFFQPGNQRRALTPNPEMSCDLSANLQPRRAVTPSGELSWGENSRKEQNLELKENNPLNTRDIQDTSYPTYCSNNHSESTHSKTNASNVENPNSVKSNLPIRISVPSSAFYSDFCQAKSNKNVANNSLNRPASVDDILQSTTNQSTKAADTIKIDSNSSENSFATDTSKVEEVCTDNTYISRKAVENVLQLQKLQRQRSMNSKNGHIFVGQRNSSSSLESLDNVFREKNYVGALNVKDIPDAMNMARRRDSGNWSGDRNSASSSSTTSLDNPYFYVIGNKRLPSCPRNAGRNGEIPLTDPGYDSFSLSSSDSYPSIINSSPGKIDSRLGQIPENVQTAFVPYDLSKLQYCLKELKNNEHFPFGFKDECDKLCAEADIFYAKSVERENVGDISMAALLSDTAAAKARAAMDVPYTNSQALAMAKMKHGMCLIRSSNLHKKLKEAEVALRRKQKEALFEISRNTHTKASNKTATDSQNKCNSDFANCEKNSKDQKQNSSNQENNHSSSDKNIEIYATLPKRSLKKKGALSSFVESLTGDESSDERSMKEKKNKSEENICDISSQKVSPSSGTSNKEDKLSKSPCNKKKSVPSHKNVGKESDLSDYSSEWEQTKKQSLYRTYSGPTSNSKSELSDLNLNNNQSFVDQPSKKQHKIRRKLMGGFMRRKNRSLPDLREGQDSGGEMARSFDDCFFAQTPVPCRKKQDGRNSSFSDIENGMNSQLEKENSSPVHKLLDNPRTSKKSFIRTHTPPPYKPPPPITHSNQCNISPKKITQSSDASSKFELPHSIYVTKCNTISPHKSNNVQKAGHHLPLSRDPKDHRTINSQYVLHNHEDVHPASAVWLKELQLKQVEINQKRKLQEERERWLSECKSGADEKLICSKKNSESPKDDFSKNHTICMVNTDNTVQSESKYCNNQNSSLNGEQKSVRDLASRFEKGTVPVTSEVSSDEKDKISTSTTPVGTFTVNTIASENGTHIQSVQNVQYLPQNIETDHSKLHIVPDQHSMLVTQKQLRKPIDSPMHSSGKGKQNGGHNTIKQPYTSQSTSGCVYNPHLTDAQLTNVLRIGTNRSSFRNTNTNFEAQDDNFSQYSRDAIVLPEAKRPDKPPDYETAIQRLELLRNDRNFSRYYPNNCISFEALLEQAKRRRGPKKSVTFSDKVVLVACAGDEDNDFIPNPLLERVYKQHLMKPNVDNKQFSENDSKKNFCNESNSESPVSQDSSHSEVSKLTNQSPCHLCHKKMVVSPNLYCPDCSYYMSRFQQK